MMLKTKWTFISARYKRSSAARKIWPFLTYQRRRNREMEARLSGLRPSNPPRPREFLRSGFLNEHSSADVNDPESFHCAIASVLTLAQFFGVLPVSGIRKPTPFELKFRIFSLRTAYAALITAIVLVMAILSIIHMIRTLNSTTFEVQGGVAAATAGALFYSNSMVGLILFFWLAPRWVTLQRDWRIMERYMDRNKAGRLKLRWRLYAISVSVLLLALIEHILSIAANSEEFDWSGKSKNASFQSFLQMYCESSHAFILVTLRYNFALGIFIFIASKLATFTWNFTDIFIMMVSTGLAERYKVLNKQVLTSASNHQTIDWCLFRENYAVLSCIVKKVDSNISPIILLSFANNLYFICLQLLNGLSQPDGTLVSNIYFFGSFAFLIGRTIIVTLLTSRIHDQSNVVLPVLYTCSASTYNLEIERLIFQITTDNIALTGLRFFSVTRSFMLAVAGAIITYEVVLLQFNLAIHK